MNVEGWLAVAGIGLCGFTLLEGRRRPRYRRPPALPESFDRTTARIIEVALDAVVVMDAEGRIRDWNPQAEVVFRRRREDVLGRPLADFVPPAEMRAAHRAAMRTAEANARTGESLINQRLETMALRSDGTRFPVEIAITPIADGDTVGFSAFIRDISERKAAQAALRASEVRYRAAFEQAAIGMAETDLTGRFLRVNASFANTLHYSVEELAGTFVQDVALPDDAEPVMEALRRTTRESSPPYEGRFVRKDGHVVWMLCNSSLVHDIGDRGPYAITVMQDITERKLLEEALRKTQKLEAVGRLAGGVAHDFNNVLGGIMGYADLVHHAPGLGAAVREDVRAISRIAQQGAELARNLLTLARKSPSQLERVCLEDVVGEVHRLITRTFNKRIEIRTDLTPESLPVNGDRSQLSNALLNLALNARDAIPGFGRITISTRRVFVDASDADETRALPLGTPCARIEVSDTGVGMSADVKERIFDPFFTTKSNGNGTGLGLAMVFATVRAHGGVVSVRTEPGEGATFTLLIPLTENPEPETAPAPTTLMRGAGQVLVADDDPMMRGVTARMVAYLGFSVECAADGQEAVARMETDAKRYSLIVLNEEMARMTGHEAARRIREMNRDVPILLMSSSGELDADHAAHGVTATIMKPCTLAALSRLIATHVPQRGKATGAQGTLL